LRCFDAPEKEIRLTPPNERYLCVHAHFYQPPRENPWLESIEVQDSAYPYHDWNERVTAECYAPNAAARILNGEGRIRSILNNYSKISFNFGPTLLSWMEKASPEIYATILAADRESRPQRSGYGSALGQAYNHMIMPLANARDKVTQVVWGIADFAYRFGRMPEGMWLPEAAVDLASLDALASKGILFTILSPFSAKQARKIGEKEWSDVSGGKIDPSMAYRVSLPSGRKISVFFYDGPASRAIAFENLLASGENFANRLLGTYSDDRAHPQLAHIATDGETYGHHKPHGDMALAYALHYIESKGLARLTNYAEFLERFPPTHEAEIFENSSWSCAHGVERWRANCGCNSGGHTDWNQEWRAPLREALDWLRDAANGVYQLRGAELFQDPWAARDDYIRVILDRKAETICDFLRRHLKVKTSAEDKIAALRLLELQRHLMLMYTSCGWFFDELSGMETVQVIQYAGRAVQLAESLSPGRKFGEEFVEKLSRAKSNLPENGDGRQVYEKFVKPAMLDLKRVGAHYAVSSLFEDFGAESHVYCYRVSREDFRSIPAGKTKLVAGRTKITSDITGESANVSFGVVHFGDHNIAGGVRDFQSSEAYESTLSEITTAFASGDLTELVRVVDNAYGREGNLLRVLFRDEQRKIVKEILASALEEAELSYRQLYYNRAPLMRFLRALSFPPVKAFQAAAEFTLNSDFRRSIENGNIDLDRSKAILDETEESGVALDTTAAEFALRKKLETMADELQADPANLSLLQRLDAAVQLAKSVPFHVQFWSVQNKYFEVWKNYHAQVQARKARDKEAGPWLDSFRKLGDKLSFQIDRTD
jgi:alpha-amylase/alpha-mannosidase (GH57 family)